MNRKRVIREASFEELIFYAGFAKASNTQARIDKKRVCDYLTVSQRTLERWIKTNEPCPRARTLLENRYSGAIGWGEQWQDVFINRDGLLQTDTGAYSLGDIENITMLRQSLSFSQTQVHKGEMRIAKLEKLVMARKRIGEIGDELKQISDELWHGEILEDYLRKRNKTA